MKTNKLPEKYKTCDWLWNYGSIGLTKEHIKRLNNAINILESLNEHTDVKYLKEIKDKLLEDAPIPKIEKFNADAFMEKAFEFFSEHLWEYIDVKNANCDTFINIDGDKLKEGFKNYMKEE